MCFKVLLHLPLSVITVSTVKIKQAQSFADIASDSTVTYSVPTRQGVLLVQINNKKTQFTSWLHNSKFAYFVGSVALYSPAPPQANSL